MNSKWTRFDSFLCEDLCRWKPAWKLSNPFPWSPPNSTASIAVPAHRITVLSFDKAHSDLKMTMAELCSTECKDVFLILCLWLHLNTVLNHNNICTFESQILIKWNKLTGSEARFWNISCNLYYIFNVIDNYIVLYMKIMFPWAAAIFWELSHTVPVLCPDLLRSISYIVFVTVIFKLQNPSK